MRSKIIKSFLPWLILFAFADGSLLGLKIGTIGGLLCLLIFNFQSLKKKFVLDWVTLIFFLLMQGVGAGFPNSIFVKYNLLCATIVLTLVCFITLAIRKPFSLQYARAQAPKVYWYHPVFLRVNDWITGVWGVAFLFYSASIILFNYGIGTKLWMLQVLPTSALVFVLGFTILFPDIYKDRIMRQGGVATIPGISEVKRISLGNVEIGYRLLGKGPLIVLAHGSCGNMHTWPVDFLKKLSVNFQLLLFDYPGTGYSSYKQMPYTAETIANCINSLVDKLQLKPLAVLGFSMGGYIAQAYAIKYSAKIKALILVGSNVAGKLATICDDEVKQKLIRGSSREMTGEERLQNILSIMFPAKVLPRVSEKMRQTFTAAALEGVVSKEMAEREYDLMKDWFSDEASFNALSNLNLPVLIISGSEDVIVPHENAKILDKTFKKAKLIEYDDAGHGIIYQYPLDVAANVKGFLK